MFDEHNGLVVSMGMLCKLRNMNTYAIDLVGCQCFVGWQCLARESKIKQRMHWGAPKTWSPSVVAALMVIGRQHTVPYLQTNPCRSILCTRYLHTGSPQVWYQMGPPTCKPVYKPYPAIVVITISLTHWRYVHQLSYRPGALHCNVLEFALTGWDDPALWNIWVSFITTSTNDRNP